MRCLYPKSYILNPRSRRGFTLVEILVVVAITGLLTASILSYTSASRDRLALSVEETKLAQTISRAKSLALTTYTRAEPPCAYGVSVNYDTRSYSLYAYDPGECKLDSFDPEARRDAENFSLPPNVIFGAGEAVLEHVLFVPPDPKTLVWRSGEETASVSGDIYLATRNGLAEGKVEVGAGGQISF